MDPDHLHRGVLSPLLTADSVSAPAAWTPADGGRPGPTVPSTSPPSPNSTGAQAKHWCLPRVAGGTLPVFGHDSALGAAFESASSRA
jgi:hypothetical protein